MIAQLPRLCPRRQNPALRVTLRETSRFRVSSLVSPAGRFIPRLPEHADRFPQGLAVIRRREDYGT